jgi:leader peptidase (prepilin peptidase)/N-methyltransferase
MAHLGQHAFVSASALGLVSLAGASLEACLFVSAFATLCIAVARIDAHKFIIPDALVFGLGAIAALAPFRPPLADQMIGAIVMGGVFFGVRYAYFAKRGVEGLGLGDVKLAIVIGAAVGVEMALLVAGLAAACMAAWLLVRTQALVRSGQPATLLAAPFGVGLAGALGVAVAVVAIAP